MTVVACADSMYLSIDHSQSVAPALSTLKQAQRSTSALARQMSTGLRVQSAVDDAAGLALSSKFTTQIRGLAVAARNSMDAIGALQTAEDGLQEIGQLLQRMREISVQAASGTYRASDRELLNRELLSLRDQIDTVASGRRWNNMPLLEGTFAKSIQVGAESSDSLVVSVGDFRTPAIIPALAGPLVLKGSGTLQATPPGTQNYTTQVEIDTTKFANGGTITATIKLGNGVSAASYNLFRNAVTVTPAPNSVPINSLAQAYDVSPGSTTQLTYAFPASASDKYILGIEGNWGSPAGSTNSFTYEVTVTSASPQGNVLTTAAASACLAPIDQALQAVGSGRAQIGAQINALNSRSTAIGEVQIAALTSRSRVSDLDYAGATSELARQLALQASAQSIIRRHIDEPRWVVELLQAVPR